MAVEIYQGNDLSLQSSDITVVIDVIRAFTVAHYAFFNGAEKIKLVRTVEEAQSLKEPNVLLAGEINGLPIAEFDLDNSPARISTIELSGKTLVQKTTNGVKATLNALNAMELFVTGFTNAKTTALMIKRKIEREHDMPLIHLIASHPSGDDDLAVAQYMKDIIEGNNEISVKEVVDRIIHSHVALKFFDENQPEFSPEDISYCVKEFEGEFVMRVNKNEKIPTVERCLV
ncbi:2-phosphosulfolactate phosphatase [Metabacillus malikii]|uniref:Probable 2-phosphosulfolactate phosphatase n=1 Tax=Metabacillus malikii TaxID=1504265 RepID=A0ABT9ZCK0_9BACI|nr:2-phosphosulfolactate phosphatase [Metabacillus malikii]MDQ0229567.1 2-phosphosulfolactate phosphatase [Metabacillus malikii]